MAENKKQRKANFTFRQSPATIRFLQDVGEKHGVKISELHRAAMYLLFREYERMQDPDIQLSFMVGMSDIWETWAEDSLKGDPNATQRRDAMIDELRSFTEELVRDRREGGFLR